MSTGELPTIPPKYLSYWGFRHWALTHSYLLLVSYGEGEQDWLTPLGDIIHTTTIEGEIRKVEGRRRT